MNKMKCAFTISCIAILLVIISVILEQPGWSNGLSIVSTALSIVLALISIVYTYISGQNTLKNLNDMKQQYDSLVQKINYELSKNNQNDANIDNVRMELNKLSESLLNKQVSNKTSP